jgi:hypothetical protein
MEVEAVSDAMWLLSCVTAALYVFMLIEITRELRDKP